MLHQYIRRVYSCDCIFMGDCYWLRYAQKEKKCALFICSLYYSPLDSCMDVSIHFTRFICWRKFVRELSMIFNSSWDFSCDVYVFLGRSMNHPFDFCEKGEKSLGSLDSCPIYYSIHLWYDCFPCFDACWPLLAFLSLCFPLSSFHYFLSLLDLFLSFLISFDVKFGFSIHIWFIFILLMFGMLFLLPSLLYLGHP